MLRWLLVVGVMSWCYGHVAYRTPDCERAMQKSAVLLTSNVFVRKKSGSMQRRLRVGQMVRLKGIVLWTNSSEQESMWLADRENLDRDQCYSCLAYFAAEVSSPRDTVDLLPAALALRAL